MVRKKSIIYIAPAPSSFVLNDIKGLNNHYQVKSFIRNWQGPIAAIGSLIIQFFFLIINLPTAKAVVISFGGYWALLPSILGRLLNKKVIIILNGTDSSALSRFQYGMLRKGFLKTACRLSYKFADLLAPVSKSLMYIDNSFDTTSDKQGVLHYFPNLKTPHEVVYNGIDIDFWNGVNAEQRDIEILSVLSASQFYLKGGDLIVAYAAINPEMIIHIAGMEQPIEVTPLKNVTYHGKLSQVKLKKLYQRSIFYLQLSAFEGFGCALCEAMLCGAFPIVSSVNMLPEIVGDVGLVLKNKDVDALSKVLEKAKIKMPDSKESERKLQISNNFSLQGRINQLVKIIG